MHFLLSRLDLLFSSTPLEGPEQMALDEVLLRQASRPLLRLYCWKKPCVTFGYFQPWKKVHASFPGRMLVRRWSGGGAVEHDGDITFSLIVPASEPLGRIAPASFYQQFHQALVEALHVFEIKARLIQAEETIVGSSCFTAPSLHDVVIGNQKIVGGAQRRRAGNLLHQGSLCGLAQIFYADLLREESNPMDPAWSAQLPSHDQHDVCNLERSTKVTLEASSLLAKQLFSSLASKLSLRVELLTEKKSWSEEALSVAALRYRTAAWTQKR